MFKYYRITLSNGVDTIEANPIQGGRLIKQYEQAKNEIYFRESLSVKFKFLRTDYDFIFSESSETRFFVGIDRRREDSGWFPFWEGAFSFTDCLIDEDNKIIEVTPESYDRYKSLVEGLQKEFNLVDLAPGVENVTLQRRPVRQIYSPGNSFVGMLTPTDYFEEPVTPTTDLNLLQSVSFGQCTILTKVNLVDSPSTPSNQTEALTWYSGVQEGSNIDYDILSYPEGYKIEFVYSTPSNIDIYLTRQSDDVRLYTANILTILPEGNFSYVLSAVSGSGATGKVVMVTNRYRVWSRTLTNVESFLDGATTVNTQLLNPDTDPIGNLGVFTRGTPATEGNFYAAPNTSATPTKYGRVGTTDQYYTTPSYRTELLYSPVARSSWGADGVSFWIRILGAVQYDTDDQARETVTQKDTFKLGNVIRVLLAEIAPNITFEETTAYSEFFYSVANPVASDQWVTGITAKSNVLTGDYDQPAQKTPMTLGKVFDMLRTWRLFWFVDDSNRLRIEHISFFKNGGTYDSNNKLIGTDLTNLAAPKTGGMSWGFNKNRYQFEKGELPARIEFKYMDDSGDFFAGVPMSVQSVYVQEDKVDEVNPGYFSADIDLMLTFPDKFSKDGFALFALEADGANFSTVFDTVFFYDVDDPSESIGIELQNAYLCWAYIQENLYLNDAPARKITINNLPYTPGGAQEVEGVNETKLQEIWVPDENEPDTYQLIKTGLGEGRITSAAMDTSSNKITYKVKLEIQN